ncbi:ATP-binding cassette subfamily B protein [Symbiobacterium terraclitae]|uniref:ATP-binding cassette subfamily B protein n=1 Tax=Symbiobacterium terraclitae TaxID=557451 RepID=A0ABS4JV11_9FIRM|nr:ABC transporter ATP-binding protein [Symbiobacterium terraclitae]MBP2019382.1 ATP-binding cassette subfamily B protein [Symbiobacterium terraclitae]
MSSPYRSLFSFLSRYKWRYLLGVAALAGTDLLQQVAPRLIGHFVDDLEAGALDMTGIYRYLALIVGTALLIAFLRFTWRIFVFGTARLVERDLRADLFAHLERLSASFFHTHKTGDLMAMATNDLQAVRGIAGEGVLMAADSLAMTLFTLIAMISTIGLKLSLWALLPLPFLALLIAAVGKLIFARSRAVQDSFARLSDVVQENISGVRVVKAYTQEAAEEAKFDEANRDYIRRFMAMMRVDGLFDPVVGLFAGLCYVIAIAVPGRAVLRGEISVGDFASLTMYIGMLIWPMIAMGWVVHIIQRGFAAFARIREVLLTEPEVKDAPETAEPPGGRVRGEIEIRDLTFRYVPDGPPVLDGINLHIKPGQTLGILGRTGSGKSTLAALLARVFDPPRGTVFIDGIDVLDLPLNLLRRSIAAVPQESFLFSRTVRENIGFAPGEWTEEQIRQAARTAQVEQDILEFLPQGYETMVGERGVTLSGGQRQRVGLSRAVLKDAPILVLDDCLSAVDTATEQRILNGLRPLMRERTTIVISHRVAAVKNADLIIVLERGRIAEAGTHDELVALGGRYFRTYQRQQLEEAIASLE